MKTLVVYDSNFGNTKIVATTIAKELGKEVKVVSVTDFSDNDLEGIEMIVAGSPIIGWKPTEKMGMWLDNLKSGKLNGIKAAAFDTRVKLFIHGDAAKKIEKQLEEAGATIVVTLEVFYVTGKEGPLLSGEIEKAKVWGQKLAAVN
jgi:flavodoxin